MPRALSLRKQNALRLALIFVLFEVLAARGGHRVLATEVGGMHNEDSWRARLPRLLQHVLGTVV